MLNILNKFHKKNDTGRTNYARAYGTNSYGTVYGNQQVYKMSDLLVDVAACRYIGSLLCMTSDLSASPISTYPGDLYIWDEAMCISITGWHIPSASEWQTLSNLLGTDAGIAMRVQNLWYGCHLCYEPPELNGTNSSGFSSFSRGEYEPRTSSIEGVGGIDYYWSNTPAINVQGNVVAAILNYLASDWGS